MEEISWSSIKTKRDFLKKDTLIFLSPIYYKIRLGILACKRKFFSSFLGNVFGFLRYLIRFIYFRISRGVNVKVIERYYRMQIFKQNKILLDLKKRGRSLYLKQAQYCAELLEQKSIELYKVDLILEYNHSWRGIFHNLRLWYFIFRTLPW